MPRLDGGGRNTGRTTKLLQEAPLGSIFVCGSAHAYHYVRELARKLHRTDIRITAPERLQGDMLRGQQVSGVILDHSYDWPTCGRQFEALLDIGRYLQTRIPPEEFTRQLRNNWFPDPALLDLIDTMNRVPMARILKDVRSGNIPVPMFNQATNILYEDLYHANFSGAGPAPLSPRFPHSGSETDRRVHPNDPNQEAPEKAPGDPSGHGV